MSIDNFNEGKFRVSRGETPYELRSIQIKLSKSRASIWRRRRQELDHLMIVWEMILMIRQETLAPIGCIVSHAHLLKLGQFLLQYMSCLVRSQKAARVHLEKSYSLCTIYSHSENRSGGRGNYSDALKRALILGSMSSYRKASRKFDRFCACVHQVL